MKRPWWYYVALPLYFFVVALIVGIADGPTWLAYALMIPVAIFAPWCPWPAKKGGTK